MLAGQSYGQCVSGWLWGRLDGTVVAVRDQLCHRHPLCSPARHDTAPCVMAMATGHTTHDALAAAAAAAAGCWLLAQCQRALTAGQCPGHYRLQVTGHCPIELNWGFMLYSFC
jgi:hypothetical protein